MINTAFTRTIIPTSQTNSDTALAALLKGQLYKGNGYETIIACYDSMRFLDYKEQQIAVFIPSTKQLLIDIGELSSAQGLISKYNKVLRKFNLSCGLKEGQPWVKQLPGVAHSYSYYDGLITIDLRRTKECTRQSLWFMSYC